MSEWLPIETAPKDGTSLLLALSGGSLCIGLWETWVDLTTETPRSAWIDNGEGFRLEPTHWMSLPDPPQEVA